MSEPVPFRFHLFLNNVFILDCGWFQRSVFAGLCMSRGYSPLFSGHTEFLILDEVFHMVFSSMHLLGLAVLDSIYHYFPFHWTLLSDPKAPWPALALINLRFVVSLVSISIFLLVLFLGD